MKKNHEKNYSRRPSQRSSHSTNYSYGSNAYKYNDYDNNEDYVSGEKRSRRDYIKNKKRRGYKRVLNEKTVHSFKIYFAIFTFFIFSISILSSYAINIEQKIQIAELKKEYKEIQGNNTYLQTELTKNIDLEVVKKVATEDLGMSKPAKHQVVYINVPKQSYTVQHETQTKSETGVRELFENLTSKLFKGGVFR